MHGCLAKRTHQLIASLQSDKTLKKRDGAAGLCNEIFSLITERGMIKGQCILPYVCGADSSVLQVCLWSCCVHVLHTDKQQCYILALKETSSHDYKSENGNIVKAGTV